MNWKGYGRKRPWTNLQYYRGNYLERLRKLRKSCQEIRSKYEAGVLTTRPRRTGKEEEERKEWWKEIMTKRQNEGKAETKRE
jgi:hypothetical protein